MTTVDRNQQTLTDIQNLQSVEQNLFNTLASKTSNGSLTTTDMSSMISQINNLSQMRSNLYSFINNNSVSSVENLAASNNLLSQQAKTVIIVENELNDAKSQLLRMQKDKYNKLRMVEINTYYGDRYADHSSMMKSIVIICAVIILITILMNKGILPSNLYYFMFVVIVVVSVVILWYKYVMLISHDRMNYDEYDWGFNPDKAPKYDTSGATAVKNPWVNPSAVEPSTTCVGSSCCNEGMVYDASLNLCVLPSNYTSDSYAGMSLDSILGSVESMSGSYAPY
jgi:hypothetical protein